MRTESNRAWERNDGRLRALEQMEKKGGGGEKKKKTKKSFCFVDVESDLILTHSCSYLLRSRSDFFAEIDHWYILIVHCYILIVRCYLLIVHCYILI